MTDLVERESVGNVREGIGAIGEVLAGNKREARVVWERGGKEKEKAGAVQETSEEPAVKHGKVGAVVVVLLEGAQRGIAHAFVGLAVDWNIFG